MQSLCTTSYMVVTPLCLCSLSFLCGSHARATSSFCTVEMWTCTTFSFASFSFLHTVPLYYIPVLTLASCMMVMLQSSFMYVVVLVVLLYNWSHVCLHCTILNTCKVPAHIQWSCYSLCTTGLAYGHITILGTYKVLALFYWAPLSCSLHFYPNILFCLFACSPFVLHCCTCLNFLCGNHIILVFRVYGGPSGPCIAPISCMVSHYIDLSCSGLGGPFLPPISHMVILYHTWYLQGPSSLLVGSIDLHPSFLFLLLGSRILLAYQANCGLQYYLLDLHGLKVLGFGEANLIINQTFTKMTLTILISLTLCLCCALPLFCQSVWDSFSSHSSPDLLHALRLATPYYGVVINWIVSKSRFPVTLRP